MPQSREGLPAKHMKKELEFDMMCRCSGWGTATEKLRGLVCESGLRANAVLERDWRADWRAGWGLSTASSCWNKPRPGLQLAEWALSEVHLEFEIGPIQELRAKLNTSKSHLPHTHTPPTHTPTSKHSSNPGKITICPHIHRISLQRCHDAFLWGKPDTPLASLSAPSSSARPRGAAGTSCSLAPHSSSLREEMWDTQPSPSTQHYSQGAGCGCQLEAMHCRPMLALALWKGFFTWQHSRRCHSLSHRSQIQQNTVFISILHKLPCSFGHAY